MSRWSRKSHEVVADAMRLRRWMLATLAAKQSAGGSLTSMSTAGIEEVPAWVWRLALQSECAALPLLRALPEQSPIGPEIRALIVEQSVPELQRCLTAKAQLRELDTLCAQNGLSPVILKGGANMARGRELDLGDLDILLSPTEADRFTDLIDRNGYVARGPRSSHQHLPRRYATQRLPIEIHLALKAFGLDPRAVATTRSLPGYRALQVLAPGDHAWHVLHHGVAQHFNRRGVLRDLLAVGFAISDCSVDDVEMLRSKARSHRRSEQLLATIDLAQTVNAGRNDFSQHDDHLDRFTATRYALADPRFQRRFRLSPSVYTAAFIALERKGKGSDLMNFVWPGVMRWQKPSQSPVTRRAAFIAEKVARLVYHACALSISAPIAASASRTIRRCQLELNRRG